MSRSLKNLLSGLLCRDPKRRFKWHDFKNSPWCTEVCCYVDISGSHSKKCFLSNSVNSNKLYGATFHSISIHILCFSSLFFLIFSIDLSLSFCLSVCLIVCLCLKHTLSFSHFLSLNFSLSHSLCLSLSISISLSHTLFFPLCHSPLLLPVSSMSG